MSARCHRSHFASDSLVGAFEEKFQNRKWKKGVLRTLRGTVGHSVNDLLDRVPHPTLLIWGEQDRVLPVRHAHLAHACMPGSTLEVFEDAGHFPHQADPDRFVELLTDPGLSGSFMLTAGGLVPAP